MFGTSALFQAWPVAETWAPGILPSADALTAAPDRGRWAGVLSQCLGGRAQTPTLDLPAMFDLASFTRFYPSPKKMQKRFPPRVLHIWPQVFLSKTCPLVMMLHSYNIYIYIYSCVYII